MAELALNNQPQQKNFDPAKAAGNSYNLGVAAQIASTGLNFNIFSFSASICFVCGNTILSKYGSNKNAIRVSNVFYSAGATFLYLAQISDKKSLGISLAANVIPFILSYFENDNKPQNEKTFVEKLAENRAVIAGGTSLFSRIPLLNVTYERMTESYGTSNFAANALMFSAAALWTVGDILFLMIRTVDKSAEAAR